MNNIIVNKYFKSNIILKNVKGIKKFFQKFEYLF